MKGGSSKVTDRVLIETIGLEKSFGTEHVLRGVSVQVHQGEAIAIIGPSGCVWDSLRSSM